MLKQVASFTVDHTRSIDGEAPKEVARQAKRPPNGKSRMNSPELNVDIRHANRGDPDPEYYCYVNRVSLSKEQHITQTAEH